MVTIIALFVLSAGLFPAQATASVPSVEISYAEMFDDSCSQQTKYKIDPAWVSEVKERLPEIQSAWNKDGSVLLLTAEQVVGKSFSQKEFLVSLSVCSLPSVGDPILINMRYSLKSFTQPPLPLDVTISLIFHEILHRCIGGSVGPYFGDVPGMIPPNSKLLAKYANDDASVKYHLHLLALMKAVYLKLGLNDTLRRVIEKDESLPNKSYKRAWDIVNNIESYSSFVNELRQ